MRAWVVMVSVVAGCAAGEDANPSRARCIELRERIVELRLDGVPGRDRAAHGKALAAALGEPFVERCQQLTADQVKCAFAAKDSTSVAACSSSR